MDRPTHLCIPDIPDNQPRRWVDVEHEQDYLLWKGFSVEQKEMIMNLDPDEEWFQKKCRPVFNIPLLTRVELANVVANTVDRTQGELAAEMYLARRPVHISPLIPLSLIAIMIGAAALVWGRV